HVGIDQFRGPFADRSYRRDRSRFHGWFSRSREARALRLDSAGEKRMRRRNSLMHSPALFLAGTFLLLVAGEAQAHRLNAQAFLLPGNKLQVDAWFSTGEPARGAKVEIHGSGDRLIAEGKTNDKGIFDCSLEQLEELRIVVTAGAEHRKELRVSTL